ncbi:SDR family oxidoreductase [Actinospica sp. MGRD01-02]|uniref:SDR family oxidoreductase n=1 Tax=Actinospica acidithermotolerans TaxID=2828514 RepID=A0A941IGS6_9ACTN|nr:SDR family oxidoreductase [Actinospica acidithermotolerans]MBR7826454.1 SDR family oxidoreductase [Actinospica acidithermotolerans]
MAQHTVIVGGTAGIGLAAARQLAAEGHRVTVVGRDAERMKQAVAEIGGEGTQGRVASTGDRPALDALFAELGSLDNLVVTAPGTGAPGPLAELDLDALEEAFRTKFIGLAHTIQAALPYLAEDQGSITVVSAASAQQALPGTAGLAAVNGAVETLVPTLALELAPIRVNCVSPGVVDTAWWNRVVPPEQRAAVLDSFVAGTPVGRVGKPEDIADVIALLVRNRFVTGIVVPVEGGARLKP